MLRDPEERYQRLNRIQQARTLAGIIDRAVRRGISDHEGRLHELAASGPIPVSKVAEVIAWLGSEWADTGVWDVEAAAARFDIPAEILWPELNRYFRDRAGWRRDTGN